MSSIPFFKTRTKWKLKISDGLKFKLESNHETEVPEKITLKIYPKTLNNISVPTSILTQRQIPINHTNTMNAVYNDITIGKMRASPTQSSGLKSRWCAHTTIPSIDALTIYLTCIGRHWCTAMSMGNGNAAVTGARSSARLFSQERDNFSPPSAGSEAPPPRGGTCSALKGRNTCGFQPPTPPSATYIPPRRDAITVFTVGRYTEERESRFK